MQRKTKDQVIETALDEIGGLLRDHIDRIEQAMNASIIDADGDKQFKYPVSLGIVIEPFGSDVCKVSAKIGYSVKHSDESIGQTVDPAQMKLPLEPETH